ncbi:MAG: hypothetical protein WD768_05665, partial [Phycisphaeraceae bacterium]
LDRFGRVIDHRWTDYGSSTDVARSLSKKFDQQYTYDGLNRLTDFKQGLLDGSHQIPDLGADLTFRQNWALDGVGNWNCFKQDWAVGGWG